MESQRGCLEDLLSCPICFEQYDSQKFLPKLFPCGHTYCFSCVDKLCVKSKGSVSCPMDLKVIQLTTASNLVSNFTILELLSIEAIKKLLSAEKATEELRQSDASRVTVPSLPPSASSTSNLSSSSVVPRSSPNKQQKSSTVTTPQRKTSGVTTTPGVNTIISSSTVLPSSSSSSSSSSASSSFLSSMVNRNKKILVSKVFFMFPYF
eukprot:TRINITY_DN1348_c0_g2_i1.p1 TRINITY_DN1348_c0_g2~~TRINITY_DN1348_c0_g2_i1.p1  ORF type:complete len:207 (-),score=52.50 TRINITY_DN1348_c0_g2_i1:680-1300(-)